MQTVIVDYGSGNLRSVAKAIETAKDSLAKHGTRHGMRNRQHQVTISSDVEVVRHADYLILPGVGAFADCWHGLQAIDGMVDAIAEVASTRPFLGICVGMQLMADYGFEGGKKTPGFGWVSGQVTPLVAKPPIVRVPHMGWNTLSLSLTWSAASPAHKALFAGLGDDDSDEAWLYFLHGYHITDMPSEQIAATTDYGGEIVAAVAQGTRFGVQFHPEKSQASGQTLLRNWLNWRP